MHTFYIVKMSFGIRNISPGKLALKLAASEQNCNQRFFQKMFIRSALVKVYNFPHRNPLAFSPSMDLSPHNLFLACISLNIGPSSKMAVFKINLHQNLRCNDL